MVLLCVCVSLCVRVCVCVRRFMGSYCTVAYALNLLPYLGVTRQAFVYHYMPGLYYATLLTAVTVELLVPERYRNAVVTTIVAAVVVTYVYMTPWVYGFPTSFEAHARRRWIKSWD